MARSLHVGMAHTGMAHIYCMQEWLIKYIICVTCRSGYSLHAGVAHLLHAGVARSLHAGVAHLPAM